MSLRIVKGLYAFSLVFITYILGKYFTEKGIDNFYYSLEIPSITPDKSYFRWVWRFLYLLMFLSFYIILRSKSDTETYKDAHFLFILQLVLQIFWTYTFFYLEQILGSVVIILLLDMFVALMLQSFLYISFKAFVLILPYLFWLLYATYLNVFILCLN